MFNNEKLIDIGKYNAYNGNRHYSYIFLSNE